VQLARHRRLLRAVPKTQVNGRLPGRRPQHAPRAHGHLTARQLHLRHPHPRSVLFSFLSRFFFVMVSLLCMQWEKLLIYKSLKRK